MNAPVDPKTLATRIITINLPEQQQIEARASTMLASAESLIIDSDSMAEIAADELKDIKRAINALDDERKRHVKPLNDEAKYINGYFGPAIVTLQKAETLIKSGLLGYQQEQERLRQIEQKRIEDALKAEQAKLAQAGTPATPEQALVAEIITAPVIQFVPKLAGIATKATYKGECVDLLALVRFIANNPQYVNLIKPNDTAINQLAKAQRDALKIDGIRVWEEKTIAARS